jgi:hypothetical protein
MNARMASGMQLSVIDLLPVPVMRYYTMRGFGPAKRQSEAAIETAIEAATRSGKREQETGRNQIPKFPNPLIPQFVLIPQYHTMH